MNYEEATTKHWFKDTIAELNGEVYVDRWPSLANRVQSYNEAKVFCSGETFRERTFTKCTIIGGGMFHNCYFDHCIFFPADGREATISFMGGSIRNSVIGGKWQLFVFVPQFCREVAFAEDFIALDSTIRFACTVSAGLIVPMAVWLRLEALMGKALNDGETPVYLDGSGHAKADAEIRDFIGEYGETMDL